MALKKTPGVLGYAYLVCTYKNYLWLVQLIEEKGAKQ